METSSSSGTLPPERGALRAHLRALRGAWQATAAGQDAENRLAQQLRELLRQLEPQVLGLYWALDGEFNAAAALLGEKQPWQAQQQAADGPPSLALPYAWRGPQRRMEYRRWDGDGTPPGLLDECGIPSTAGAPLLPDVLLLPCVGFTREGYRLGYGGGYFDRWLAAHPGVTAVGIAWSCSEIAQFAAQPHDQALTVIVTEREVIVP